MPQHAGNLRFDRNELSGAFGDLGRSFPLIVGMIAVAKLDATSVLYGGGLAIGLMMLLLAITGLLDWLAKLVPHVVIRGIQFGLGIQLTRIAVADYVPFATSPPRLRAS